MKKRLLLFVAVLMATLSGTVQGQLYNSQPFNTTPTLSATQAAGVWYPDRYRPASFESFSFNGENVLKLGISQSDGLVLRPSGYNGIFYNTQGRDFDLANDVTVVYGSLYIPADWATKHRRSDLWATAFDNTGSVTDYPIIGFANTTGSNPTFRWYDENTDNWVTLATPIVYDRWYKFKIAVANEVISYFINDDLVATTPMTGSKYFGNLMVQAYNFNDAGLGTAYDSSSDATYDVYWDNVGSVGKIVTTFGTPVLSDCGTLDVPVKVQNFTDVGTISLQLNFDITKLSYTGITSPVSFSYKGLKGPGLFALTYSGSGLSLTDNTALFTLHFNLLPAASGTTYLTWKNIVNTGNCEYAAAGGEPIYTSVFTDNTTVPIPVRPVVITGKGSYCTIQAAIDAAATGDVITVAAGTYKEDILIEKSITLNGNNAGLSGCSGHSNPESIIYPKTNDANPTSATSMPIIYVKANNVTIDGFTIDGHSGEASTYSIEGVTVNSIEGIGAWDGVANLEIKNNIIQNLTDRGIDIYNYSNSGAMTTGNKVHHNKLFNINPRGLYSGAGAGVLVYNNAYTDITDNCMDQVRKGIQTGNYSQANTNNVSPIFANNNIKSFKIGIWNNLTYAAATPFNITNNQIQTTLSSTENSGIEISTIDGTCNVLVNGNTVTGAMAGINLWSNTTTAPLAIGANTLIDCDYGVFANNWDGYNDNANSSSYIINGGTITDPLLAGVYVKDNSLNTNGATVAVNVAGTSISGTAAGMKAFLVEGAGASLSFSGATPQATVSGAPKYIVLKSNGTDVPAGNIDATAVSFDSKLGSAMLLAELFATEDKIDHKIDLATLGFVTVKALNAYVTDIATSAAVNNDYTRIRNAVELVANNWTINLHGTFDWVEANAAASWALGNDGVSGNDDDYTVLVPANLTGVTFTAPEGLGNATIQGPGDLPGANLEGTLNFWLGNNQNWTISNLKIFDFDGAIGMYYKNTTDFNNLVVTNNHIRIPKDLNTTVASADVNQNIGIHFAFGTNQTFSNNIFDVEGDGISDGTKYSTSVVMQSNTSGGTVYDGLKIINNTINITGVPDATNPAVIRGIWENGANSGAAIEISGNKFTNIDVANTADKNRQVALWITSISSTTKKVEYKNNEVSGFNEGIAWIGGAYTSYGSPAYLTGQFPVEIMNNKFDKMMNAVVVRKAVASTNAGSPALINFNSFTNPVSGGLAIKNEGTGDAASNCNWFGTTSGSGIAAKVSGPVNFTPWLTNGTDNDVATGFQPVDGSCGGTPVLITSATPDDIICGEASGSILVAYTGGTAPYSIVWTGGSALTITSPYTITGLPAGVCSFTITDANGTQATSSATVLYLPVTNTSTSTYYPTIQAAINAAANGNVISVCAGTYAEDVVVNKELTLKGPNFGISPNGGVRVNEAIIVPATSDATGEIIKVQASKVKIDGFTINGDNPLLTSGNIGTNGADLDAAEAVTVYVDNVNQLTVTNNIIQNLTYFGVTIFGATYSAPATTGHLVSNNLFQNMGHYNSTFANFKWGGGVLIYNGQYTRITDNVMTNVRIGVQTGNFHALNTGDALYQVIDNNTIQSRRNGIFYNLHTGNPSPLTLSNNTITALANANETGWRGIAFSSLSEAIGVASNNTINASGVTIPSTGYEVWNVKSNAPASIIGGSVTGVDFGVFANNFEGYSSNAGDGAYANVSGLTITTKSAGIGVRVFDSPSSTTHAAVRVTVNNCTISGGLEGVKFQETQAGTVGGTVNGNTISASAIGIDVTSAVTSSTNPLSITNNQFSLTSQLAGTTPTTAILLSKVTGTAAATISSNTISGSYYGYMVYNLNTLPKTTIAGGTITGVMQGVAAINIDPATLAAFAPSTLGVSDITMSSFAGNYPAIPNSNFHAGVYVYTGGAGDATGITATVDKVSVTGTGKIGGDCAALSFADFSTNSANMQNITVTECTLTNNLNRGINVRGKNALVNINTSTLTGNGSDPYGIGGNDGFGIIVREGAVANVANCFITNPAAVAGGYNVSALCTDPGTAANATINATENSLSQGGNATSWLANNSNGTLATTCNWWGTALTSGIASKINGTVTYPTWLVDGTDDSSNAGFQPKALACAGSPVVMTCGVDVTVSSCSTQAVVDAAYAAFLASTTASGCSGVLTNNAPVAAPSICGGSVDVTWTYTSNCEVKTCIKTFTVTPAPAITLTCAVDVTVPSCQAQPDVNAAYAAWLGTVVASGGCNGALTNDNPVAPLATGGSKTVTFTYTSSCAPFTTTCSATFTVAAPKTISGTLKYYNAALTPVNHATTFTPPIGNVVVTLSNGQTCTTAGDGNYSFTGLCDGDYTITVSINKEVGYINATDAGAVNKWGVGGGGLIQYVKFLAGDVALTKNFVDATDALRIQEYFVNSVPFDRPAWSYWKSGATITNNYNPYATPANHPDNITVSVNGADVTNFNLYAMCTGDFNGSFIPDPLKSAGSALTLRSTGNLQVGADQEFELTMRAGSAMEVGAVSMILNVPSDLVQVQGIKVNGSTAPVTWAMKGNELRIGWNSVTPVNVMANESLITLKLKTSKTFTAGNSIDFALSYNPLNELADGNFNVVENATLLVAKAGNLTVGIQDINENKGLLISNYPNPFRNSTTVSYTLPVDGKVTIDLYNQLGQLVTSLVDANQNAGKYLIKDIGNNLLPGIYIAKLRLSNNDVNMFGTIKLSVLK